MTFRSHFNDDLDASIARRLGDQVTFSPGDTYPNRNDDTIVITGKLDKAFLEVNGVETKRKVFEALSSLLEDAVHGSMVEDGSDKYRVVQVEPDDSGMTMLVLETR